MAAPQSSPLPEAPTRGEAEGQFVPKANAFVGALEPFRQQLQAQADFVNERSTETEENAALAQDASEMALSSANFAGDWSGLSGAFYVPTSVLHDDTYWQLLEDVSNIQDAEPGVSDAWAPINVARSAVLALPDITALSSINTAALVDGQQFSVGGSIFRWDAAEEEFKLTTALYVSAFGNLGTSDDTEVVRSAHEYANSIGAPLIYAGIPSISVQADAQIPVNTSVDFADTQINILDGMVDGPDYSIERNCAFLIRDPERPRVTGHVDVDGENFATGSFSYPEGLIPGPGFLSFILEEGDGDLPELSNRAATDRAAWRACAKVYSSISAQYPMPVDGSNVTRVFRVYRLDSRMPIEIKNARCDASQFNNQTLFRVERNGVTIDNVKVIASGEIPAVSINALVSPFECSDFTLRRLSGPLFRNTNFDGTYYFNPRWVANYLVEDCDVRSPTNNNWGWMSSGYCNGARFERSQLNRIDIHDYSQNYFIKRCTLFDRGVTVGQGGGILSVKDCTHYPLNRGVGVVGSRSDYGGSFDGTVEVDGLTVITSTFGGPDGLIIVDWARNPIGNAVVPLALPQCIKVSNVTVESPETSGYRPVRAVSFRVKEGCAGVHAPASILVDGVTGGGDLRVGVEVDLHNCLRPLRSWSTTVSISNIANRSRSIDWPTFATLPDDGVTPKENSATHVTIQNVARVVAKDLGQMATSSFKVSNSSVCRGEFSDHYNVEYAGVEYREPIIIGSESSAPLCPSSVGARFSTAEGGRILGAFNFSNFAAISGVASTSGSASGSEYPSGVSREQLHSGWMAT